MLSSILGKRSFSGLDIGVTKVASNVLWIGVNDWDMREFHSMECPIGTSYNSYLIQSSEPTIIDAVKHTLAYQWIDRLKAVGGEDLKGIKRIVMNHAEPDHTSGLPLLIKEAPHIEVTLTKDCFDTLSRFYDTSNWRVNVVELGKNFSIGDVELVMAGVPFAHWPESAVTYIPKQGILFSSDCFGQHIASTKRFLDEIDPALFMVEAKSYYSNILGRLGKHVLKALDTAKKLPNLKMVLPAHGVGFRRPEDISTGIKAYTEWAKMKAKAKVSVIYDCNWFGTEKMAVAVASGIAKAGADAIMMHARRTHITRTASECIDSAALAIGSPVLHEAILPDLAAHLSYIRCLGMRNKAGAIFGTYGWNRDIVPREVRNQLFKPLKIHEVVDPVLALWSPKDEDFINCEKLGMELGKAAVEKASE